MIEEEQKSKKKALPVVVILVLLAISIILLGSYALWQMTKKQSGRNVVGTACLSIDIEDESGDITLENQYPMSDADGANTNPYTFTVTNNCDQDVNYIVALESLPAGNNESSSYLDYDYIRLQLDNDSPLTYGTLEGITNDNGVRDTKEITHHTLGTGESVEHSLRIWLKEDTPLQNEDESYNTEKYFYGKIKVLAGQGIEGDPGTSETRYNMAFKSSNDLISNFSSINSDSCNLNDAEGQKAYLISSNGNLYILLIECSSGSVYGIRLFDASNEVIYEFYSSDGVWKHESEIGQGMIYEEPPALVNAKLIHSINELDYEYQVMFDGNEDIFYILTDHNNIQLLFDMEEISGGSNSSNTLKVLSTVGEPDVTLSNIQVGDRVGYGTEQFYVIGIGGNNVKLLSRYLLNVGDHINPNGTEGLQYAELCGTRTDVNDAESTAPYRDDKYFYGAVPFSYDNYWWSDSNNTWVSPYSQNSFAYNDESNIKQYVDSYVNTLNTMGLTVSAGTLLSIQELGYLCNNNSIMNDSDIDNCPNYVFETKYWLASIYGNEYIWAIDPFGDLDMDNNDRSGTYGVRPVITVTLN